LIVARTLDAYASQFTSVINGLDRPDVTLRIDLTFVVVNMTLNVALVFQYGWVGAAVATLVSTGVSLVLGISALTRLIGAPDVPVREIGEELVASLLMFGAVVALERVAPSGMWATVALVLVGAGIYTGILLGISPRIRQKGRALVS
jgi:O-antigen/teichoic acid export membrane protein